jgi:O-antigen/teichoic acid export membrane protein
MACAGAFRLVAMLIAIGIGDIEALVAAYAIGTAMGSALQAFIAYRVGWRKWPSDGPSRPSVATARKLMPFAIHSSLTTTILGATDSIILIFLGRVSGSTAAALFRIATLPQMAAALASAPLRLVMFPAQQKLAAQGRLEELRRDLFRWTAIATAVATPAAVAGVFLLPWLIPAIYGHQYAGAVPAAQILVVFAWTAFAVPWTKNFAAIIGRPRLQSLLAGLMLVIALPVTIAFRDSGATAAAAGVSAGAVAMTLGYLWAARRYFDEQRRSGVRDDGADDVREPLAEVAAG